MMTSVKLGERIAAARKRRRMTQAALAEALGVSRPTLAAVEKGGRRPPDEELIRIAELLDVPLHDLLKEHAAIGEVSPRFRIGPGKRPRDEEVEQAVERLRDLSARYVELERINGLERAPSPFESLNTYRVPGPGERMSPEAGGEHAARSFRSWLDLGDAPVPDLGEILETEAGLRVFRIALPSRIAAILLFGDELGGCIGVNRHHVPERQQWSLAHEMGHYLRDREAGDLLPSAGPARRDPSEIFADSFARELLLPETGVKRRFGDRVRAQGAKFTVADLVRLAAQFGVSLQAMALRLEDLHLLPTGSYDRILSAGMKVGEMRQELGIESTRRPSEREELPERYRQLAVAAWREAEISETELADYLQTDRTTARTIARELSRPGGVEGPLVELGQNLLDGQGRG